MQRFRNSLLGILTITMFASCGQETLDVVEGVGDYEVSQLPIFGGAAPDAPMHDAVVSIHQLARGGNSVHVSPLCSGTLIASDVVLTAAHCMVEVSGLNMKERNARDIAVHVGDDPRADIISHLYSVSEITVHPSYDPFVLVNDIALIRLAGDAAAGEGVNPVEALTTELALSDSDIGADLNFAGFGQTENGTSGIKLQVDAPLGGFGCAMEGCSDEGDVATQISYSQTFAEGEIGPCFGDSGGPAFIERDGVPYVAGITSYGDSNCTQYGVSTRVDAFDAFIQAFIAGATEPPPEEPNCSADGVCNVDCAEDPDCGAACNNDGVCGIGESCDGRDGTTQCADCAGIKKGNPSNRYCFIEGVCVGEGCL